MTDQTNHQGELDNEVDNQELNQEDLETRPQDEVDNDTVKIPKKDFASIKKQLKTANSEAKTYREKLQSYEQQLEELKQAQQHKDDKDADESRVDRKELEKQRKTLEQKYQKELDQIRAEKEGMQKRLETTLIESAARDAIRAEKGVPELILDQVVKSSVLVQNERGGYDVRIVDDNGEPDFNDRGEYMTIQEKVQSLKNHEIFGRAFEATVKQGAGLQGQQGNRKPRSSVTKTSLKSDKRARNAFIAKNGIQAYNELPE